MHNQFGNLVQKHRGVQKSEWEVTSAFETIKQWRKPKSVHARSENINRISHMEWYAIYLPYSEFAQRVVKANHIVWKKNLVNEDIKTDLCGKILARNNKQIVIESWFKNRIRGNLPNNTEPFQPLSSQQCTYYAPVIWNSGAYRARDIVRWAPAAP